MLLFFAWKHFLSLFSLQELLVGLACLQPADGSVLGLEYIPLHLEIQAVTHEVTILGVTISPKQPKEDSQPPSLLC